MNSGLLILRFCANSTFSRISRLLFSSKKFDRIFFAYSLFLEVEYKLTNFFPSTNLYFFSKVSDNENDDNARADNSPENVGVGSRAINAKINKSHQKELISKKKGAEVAQLQRDNSLKYRKEAFKHKLEHRLALRRDLGPVLEQHAPLSAALRHARCVWQQS